jgi:hypothetical protein
MAIPRRAESTVTAFWPLHGDSDVIHFTPARKILSFRPARRRPAALRANLTPDAKETAVRRTGCGDHVQGLSVVYLHLASAN